MNIVHNDSKFSNIAKPKWNFNISSIKFIKGVKFSKLTIIYFSNLSSIKQDHLIDFRNIYFDWIENVKEIKMVPKIDFQKFIVRSMFKLLKLFYIKEMCKLLKYIRQIFKMKLWIVKFSTESWACPRPVSDFCSSSMDHTSEKLNPKFK